MIILRLIITIIVILLNSFVWNLSKILFSFPDWITKIAAFLFLIWWWVVCGLMIVNVWGGPWKRFRDKYSL